MSEEAISAQGTKLYRSIDPAWPPFEPQGGTTDFKEIAELKGLKPPALQRNALETTTHNNEEDGYIVGIKRRGEVDASINFVPDNETHKGLQESWEEGLRDIWRIDFPNGSQWMFSGFLTNFEPDAQVDDILVADLTIRPTGVQLFIL